MNHAQYAQQVLAALPQAPTTLPPVQISESRRNNAGRCMTALACHRLARGGEAPQHLRHTTFEWNGGVIALRNSRITDHHWSTAQNAVVQQFHELGRSRPVVYVLIYWAIKDRLLHVWAVPENVAFDAFARLPYHANADSKTVEVGPDDHQLKNAPGAPNFAPYYAQTALTDAGPGSASSGVPSAATATIRCLLSRRPNGPVRQATETPFNWRGLSWPEQRWIRIRPWAANHSRYPWPRCGNMQSAECVMTWQTAADGAA